MIDPGEPVHEEVYAHSMRELLDSPGWQYLEARLNEKRDLALQTLMRLSQDYQSRATEIAAIGAIIKVTEDFINLPYDMAKETSGQTPVRYEHGAPRGRRFMNATRR